MEIDYMNINCVRVMDDYTSKPIYVIFLRWRMLRFRDSLDFMYFSLFYSKIVVMSIVKLEHFEICIQAK